jgi:hypothetical protein
MECAHSLISTLDNSMEEIPDLIKAFILANFETVDQLRILLFLRANPERVWNALSVSFRLELQPDLVRNSLQILRHKGFLQPFDTGSHHYHYKPANAELEQMVRMVAELDRTRPVTLIRLIYSRPQLPSTTVADGFKLRS